MQSTSVMLSVCTLKKFTIVSNKNLTTMPTAFFWVCHMLKIKVIWELTKKNTILKRKKNTIFQSINLFMFANEKCNLLIKAIKAKARLIASSPVVPGGNKQRMEITWANELQYYKLLLLNEEQRKKKERTCH
jgi:hypothetical protein